MKLLLILLFFTGVGYSSNYEECNKGFEQWFEIQELLAKPHSKDSIINDLKEKEEELNEFLQSNCG